MVMKSVGQRFVLSILLIASALAWLASPAGLRAQDAEASTAQLEAACAAIENSSVGDWTRHSVDSGNTELEVQFSLVTRDGGTWYEIRSTTAAGLSILQLRVPGYPFTPAEIDEAVMKAGSSPAVRLPAAMIDDYRASAAAGPLSDLRAECRRARVVGHEVLRVDAGRFDATHLQFPGSGGEIWVSADVPFGIVRGMLPGQGEMELLEHGDGATSSITEAPLSLGGSGGAAAGGDP